MKIEVVSIVEPRRGSQVVSVRLVLALLSLLLGTAPGAAADASAPRVRRRAVIDIGSWAAKLLVSDPRGRPIVDVARDTLLVDASKNGRLGGPKLAPTIRAVLDLAEQAKRHGVAARDITLIGTAALRDNVNGGEIVRRLAQRIGTTDARVIDGEEEAVLGYRAAARVAGARSDERIAVADFGGGSFQVTEGRGEAPDKPHSVGVGSRRVQQELATDEPKPADLRRLATRLRQIAKSPIAPMGRDGRLLLIGWDAKLLAAKFGRTEITAQELAALYERLALGGKDTRERYLREGLDAQVKQRLGLDTEEAITADAQILPADLALISHVVNELGCERVELSDADIRHGTL